jgi:hypothetical protein
MDSVNAFFSEHQDSLAEWGVVAGHTLVGCVLSGLTLGCIYFLHFIAGVLRLEKGSR